MLLGPLALVFALIWSWSTVALADVDCLHGNFSHKLNACQCEDGWAPAGVTDTVDWLGGICEQYHCRSDDHCQAALGIPGATCPIPGWNCYCGWRWAGRKGGTGYETSKGKCMGLMYTFSVWSTLGIELLATFLWKVFALLAAVALPFGRKRAICDHHWPSLWNTLRGWFSCQPQCRGECVMSREYTLDSFKDDLAWTLYALDVCVWLYLFLAFTYVFVMFIWSAVLWLMVLVIFLAMCVGAVCMGAGEGLASCEAGEASAEGGACFHEGCANWEAGCCCDCETQGALDATDAFYWYGPFPQSSYYYCDLPDSSDGQCSCCPSSCRPCLRPLAWLLYNFPHLPENAWGGLCGYFLLGTHHLTPQERLYTGGSAVVEFFRMGWRRPADLHSDSSWRERVRQFLLEEEPRSPASPETSRSPHGVAQVLVEPGGWFSSEEREEETLREDVVTVGPARAKLIRRSFRLERDQCFPSSFEDYKNNECWICKDSNEQWDLWLSCRHLFCKSCSTEMLQRRMPCPLCRVASDVVLRGKAYRTEELPTVEGNAGL